MGEWPLAAVGTAKNIGNGPALDVKLCAHKMEGEPVAQQLWQSETTQGIAAGSEATFVEHCKAVPTADGTSPDRYRALVGTSWYEDAQEVVIVQYVDWFGTYYRTGPKLKATEIWRPGSGIPKPDWVHRE